MGRLSVQRDPERLLVSGQLFETMPIAEDTSQLIFNPSIGQAAYLFPQQNGQVRAYLIHHSVQLQSQLYRAVLAASEAVLLPHKTIPTGRAGIPS